MKTNAPKEVTWFIALIIGAIGVLATLVPIAVLAPYAFWLVVIALVLLLVATVLPNL
jgi:hypothetical protein